MKKFLLFYFALLPLFLTAQNGLTAGQDHLFRQISFTSGGSLSNFQSAQDSFALNNIFYCSPFRRKYNTHINQNTIIATNYNDKWAYPGIRQLADGLKPTKVSIMLFDPSSNVIYSDGGNVAVGGGIAEMHVNKITPIDSATGNPIPLIVSTGVSVLGNISTPSGSVTWSGGSSANANSAYSFSLTTPWTAMGYVTGTPWTGMGYVTGTPWTSLGYLTGTPWASWAGSTAFVTAGKIKVTALTSDSTISPNQKDYGNTGTAISFYLSQANTHTATRNANCTVMLIGAKKGTSYTFIFTHESSTTVYTLAFSPTIKWQGGTAPTWTNTATGIDCMWLKFDGTNYIAGQGADFR